MMVAEVHSHSHQVPQPPSASTSTTAAAKDVVFCPCCGYHHRAHWKQQQECEEHNKNEAKAVVGGEKRVAGEENMSTNPLVKEHVLSAVKPKSTEAFVTSSPVQVISSKTAASASSLPTLSQSNQPHHHNHDDQHQQNEPKRMGRNTYPAPPKPLPPASADHANRPSKHQQDQQFVRYGYRSSGPDHSGGGGTTAISRTSSGVGISGTSSTTATVAAVGVGVEVGGSIDTRRNSRATSLMLTDDDGENNNNNNYGSVNRHIERTASSLSTRSYLSPEDESAARTLAQKLREREATSTIGY